MFLVRKNEIKENYKNSNIYFAIRNCYLDFHPALHALLIMEKLIRHFVLCNRMLGIQMLLLTLVEKV